MGLSCTTGCEKITTRLTEHFLFITGDAGNAGLHEKLNRLGAPVLRKPFTLEILVQESRRLIKRKITSMSD